MNHKGFGKVASHEKSLRQELRKFCRKARLGERKYGARVLSEVARIEGEQLKRKSNSDVDEATHEGIKEQSDTSNRRDASLLHSDGQDGETTRAFVQRSADIDPSHREEWLLSSVDSEIIDLNVKSLSGDTAFDYLIYSDKISRRNDGRLRDGDMRRYAHLYNGGWWCSGINIITGEDSLWGCFKSNTPRVDEGKGKPIKYEHPLKVDTEIFALRVPSHIWELINRRYDVALPENYQSLPYSDFWRWVKENTQIPVIICEGAKKAAALLSCGYVAIGLPGIWGGRRQPKDEYGENNGAPYLIPQLAAFAQPERRIYFCFDQDEKRTTIRSVNSAIAKTAKLLSLRGCKDIKIMCWHPSLGKGIDDVLATLGREQLDEIYRNAITLDEWNTKQLKRLTYAPDLSLNQRYLGEVSIPSGKQLIALKSPKNTGKTHWFTKVTDPVIRSGEKKVLLITHRVQLGIPTAERLGIPFITEVKEHGQGSHFGMVLVIDSLHPKSQAKFNPDEWKGCWVILDEVQQLLWHLLSSSTCQKDRVSIIKTFKRLLLNVVNYGGKIFVADADLNDISIDFIKALVGEVETFIIQNDYKFQEFWNVHRFTDKSPARMVKLLDNKLGAGEKHFLCLSGQKAKSRWGTRNLESLYKKSLPNLRILRIDSETVSDPNHPAFGCASKLNEIIKDYDLVISSPTIETGVSIETEHFDGVWGIFQGVQTTDSVRQHLSRVRPPVPRYIWLKPIGINRVGNGATTVKGLLSGEYKKDKANVNRLMQSGFEESIDGSFEQTPLNTWAKFGAIINAGMKDYTGQIIADLEAEGHKIIVGIEDAPSDLEAEELKLEVNKTRDENYQLHREAVESTESIPDEKYEKLSKQQCKTETERLQKTKGDLERRYNISVDADLVKKDDENWYSQIRLHYYFDKGREFLNDKEHGVMSAALKNGDGDYFIPDTNRSLIGNKIDILDWFKLDELMAVDEISNTHPLAKENFDKFMKPENASVVRRYYPDLKASSPMTLSQKIVGLVGRRFPCLRREGRRGSDRTRIYGKAVADYLRDEDDKRKPLLVDGKAVEVKDRREEVFAAWVERDTLAREKAAQEKQAAIALAEKTKIEAAEIAAVISHQSSVVSQESQVKNQEPVADIRAVAIVSNEIPATTNLSASPHCLVRHFGQWRKAIINYWEDKPHEKFFKAIVEFLDGGTRIVWQRECIHLLETSTLLGA